MLITSPWLPVAVEYLRAQAEQKRSAVEIAIGLTTEYGIMVSRNAVIGKCKREGIKLGNAGTAYPKPVTEVIRERAEAGDTAATIASELRSKGFNFSNKQITEWCRTRKIRLKTPAPDVPERKTTRQRMIEKRVAEAIDWSHHESPPLPSSKPITLIELREHTCRWPLGRNEHGERLFCGGFKLSGSNPNRPIPYCKHHNHMALATDERTTNDGQKEAA